MARTSKNYVNNKSFYEALVKRKELIDKAVAEGKEPPEIDKYICECIMHICNRLIYRPNFINYSYKDEMVSEAIFSCIVNVDKYNIEFTNPFAYFTQCAWNAYIGRIKQEKNQTKIKAALFQSVSTEFLDIQDHDADENFDNGYVEFMKNNAYMDIDLTPAPKKEKKKKEEDVSSPLEEYNSLKIGKI